MNMYLSRTMYCERCAKAHYPKLHQLFFVWSKSQASFIVHEAEMRNMSVGFTPHTIIYDPSQNENQEIEVRAYCSMMDVNEENKSEGCGIFVSYPKGKDHPGQVNFNIDEAKTIKLKRKDWKAFRLNSDTGYHLD